MPYSFPLSTFGTVKTLEKEPLESRGISFTAPNFNIIKMFSSTQGSTDLLENSNEFVKNTGGVGFSRLLRLQVAGLT